MQVVNFNFVGDVYGDINANMQQKNNEYGEFYASIVDNTGVLSGITKNKNGMFDMAIKTTVKSNLINGKFITETIPIKNIKIINAKKSTATKSVIKIAKQKVVVKSQVTAKLIKINLKKAKKIILNKKVLYVYFIGNKKSVLYIKYKKKNFKIKFDKKGIAKISIKKLKSKLSLKNTKVYKLKLYKTVKAKKATMVKVFQIK
jgi:hypothetical protein